MVYMVIQFSKPFPWLLVLFHTSLVWGWTLIFLTVCRSFSSLSSLWHIFSTPQFPRGLFHLPLFRKIGLSQSFLLSHCPAELQGATLRSKRQENWDRKKRRGHSSHFWTVSPFWTRTLDSHLWLTSLLSGPNNTVLQMGWSLGRVRREKKKRNGEESLYTHQQRSPHPVI